MEGVIGNNEGIFSPLILSLFSWASASFPFVLSCYQPYLKARRAGTGMLKPSAMHLPKFLTGAKYHADGKRPLFAPHRLEQ